MHNPLHFLVAISCFAFCSLCSQWTYGQFDGPHPISKPFVRNITIKDIDLDKDGDIDLLTTTNGKNGLVWYENQGEGIFSEQQIIGDIPSVASQLQWIDFDLDGHEDLVFRIGKSGRDFPFLANTLVWCRNNRHQAFNAPAPLIRFGELEFHDLEIEAQDMDGDGDSDFLFYIRQASTYILEWYENTGQQAFQLKNRLVQEELNWRSHIEAIEDLDGDGDLDLLTSHWSNCHLFDCGFTLYRNNGAEDFTKETLLAHGTTIVSSFKDECRFAEIEDIFDYDLDGKRDIIARINGNTLMWLKNEGNGIYAVPQLIQRFYGGYDEKGFYFFDINNNGFKDIFFTSAYRMRWKSYSGGAQLGPWIDIPFTAKYPSSWFYDWKGDIYPQDLDRDGDIDFVRVEKNIVETYQNDGLGDFVQIDSLTPDYEITQLLFNDFDEDGKMDMVIYQEETRSVWLHQIGEQQALEEAQLIAQPNISLPHSILTADLNGDDWMDVIVLSLRDNRVLWYPSEGNGVFGEQRLIAERGEGKHAGTTGVALEFEKQYIAVADLDGDGDTDIIHSVEGELEGILVWQANDGLGNFSPPMVIADAATHENASSYGEPEEAEIIKAVDMDKDGDMDLVVKWSRQIALYDNDGSGAFTKIFSGDKKGNVIDVADLNGDGLLDILTINSRFGWYRNEGSNNFTYQHSDKISDLQWVSFFSAKTADFDKDGDIDIMVNGMIDGYFAWYENDGTGYFQKHKNHPLEQWSTIDIERLDWNFDGKEDLISSGFWGAVFYESDGKGGFEVKYKSFEQGPTPFLFFGSSFADLDNDGDMDMVVESPFYDQIAWYENKITPFLIRGASFLDENKNGFKDAGEHFLSNQTLVLNPKDEMGYGTGEGKTTFHAAFGDYSLSYEPNTLWELTTSNEAYPITVTGEEELPIYEFGFAPTRTFPKVTPYLISTTTRCNQAATYWLNYSNTGTTTASGIIQLEVHEQMALISANPEPDLIEGNNWIWYFSDLPPSFNGQIRLEFQMPNTDWIGEMMTSSATIKVLNEQQEIVSIQTDQYDSELRCSYDPNDKLVRTAQGSQPDLAYVGDTLLYTIRFQNTGNDMAFNIRLEDLLDRNLDWTTFHPIAASHPYRTILNEQTGMLAFYFDNILLPDSTTNEPDSHGFMLYGIAPLQDSHVGVPIHNTAAIYFDFNPPIITNTTENVVVHDLVTDVKDLILDNGYSILVYPNPFSDYTTIEVEGLPEGDYQLEVMDILGRKVRTLVLEEEKARLERGKLGSGVYFFRVLEKGKLKVIGEGKVLVE